MMEKMGWGACIVKFCHARPASRAQPGLATQIPLTPTCRGKPFQERHTGAAVERHHALCLSHSSNVACGLSSLNDFGDNRQ